MLKGCYVLFLGQSYMTFYVSTHIVWLTEFAVKVIVSFIKYTVGCYSEVVYINFWCGNSSVLVDIWRWYLLMQFTTVNYD